MTASESELVGVRPLAAGRPSRRLHWLITALASLAFAGNGVALSANSFALPGIRQEWGLTPPELGLLSAALAFGQICGSLMVGSLADHWGRRQVFAATIALAAVATGLSGLAPSPPVLTLLVFGAGLGIGGVAPVATTLVGEFAPPSIRGQAMALTQFCWSIGWCLSALGGAALAGSLGWRWIIALGAAPVLLAVVGWRLTPESPRFLLARGRRAEAEALVAELQARYGVRLPLPRQQQAGRANPLVNLRELWGPRYRRRTVTLWLTWFVMNAVFSGPVIWLPAILSASGGAAAAARSSFLIGLFMIPATLVCVLVIDRSGRRPMLIGSLGVSTLGVFGLALAGPALAVILAGGAMAAGMLAAWPIVLGYTAELYPTRVRATAAGWAGAFSRSGGVVAPLLLGGLLSSWGSGLTLALSVFGILLLLAILLVAVQGEETRGRTLEELSG